MAGVALTKAIVSPSTPNGSSRTSKTQSRCSIHPEYARRKLVGLTFFGRALGVHQHAQHQAHTKPRFCSPEDLGKRVDDHVDIMQLLFQPRQPQAWTKDRCIQLFELPMPLALQPPTAAKGDPVATSVTLQQVHNNFGHTVCSSAVKLLQYFIRDTNAFMNFKGNKEVYYAKTAPIGYR